MTSHLLQREGSNPQPLLTPVAMPLSQTEVKCDLLPNIWYR